MRNLPASLSKLASLALLFLLLPWSAAQAQGLDIGLVSGNEAALPIAVVPMPYQGRNAAPDTDVAKVIRDDLNRSGQFKSLAVENMPPPLPTRGADIDFAAWRLRKQPMPYEGFDSVFMPKVELTFCYPKEDCL